GVEDHVLKTMEQQNLECDDGDPDELRRDSESTCVAVEREEESNPQDQSAAREREHFHSDRIFQPYGESGENRGIDGRGVVKQREGESRRPWFMKAAGAKRQDKHGRDEQSERPRHRGDGAPTIDDGDDERE